jgi:predicted GIY-YIG superfamily endonuclease
MLTKQYYIYIMTNKLNTTLYIGITNDLNAVSSNIKITL